VTADLPDRTARVFEAAGVRRQVPLAPLTTWHIGGPAQYFLRTAEPERLAECRAAAEEAGLPVWFLGRGSNLLVADSGVPGLVLCPLGRDAPVHFDLKNGRVRASAGVLMPALARQLALQGFAGLDFLSAIPGSLGGGVVMNAGLSSAARRELAHFVDAATVVGPGGVVRRLGRDSLAFDYRTSPFQNGRDCLVEVELQVTERATPADLLAQISALQAERRKRQPLGIRTAGSTFFADPETGRAAGYFLDQVGAKGLAVGDARVSDVHANWIENTGNATSADVEALLDRLEGLVQARFGVALRREVRRLPAWPPAP
jgi:UDP-N-acetylmuramate dehydrogenase